MASFVTIPSKRTNEVDLVTPLKAYIRATFGAEGNPAVQNIDEQLNELNKLRNKAVCAPLDRHESSLELLYRYYDQLVAMETKMPLTPTQIPIAFKWKDAFDKGSLFFGKASLTLSYGSFEKAAVLFNIAALQSQTAAAQQLATDEELKTCAKLFQQSAGVLTHLKDGVLAMVQQEPTPDLMPDTLNALTTLMLAQGQEAIYLKAAKDKMKPPLLVKIAAQAAEFYLDVSKQLNRETLKTLWDREWQPLVNGKLHAFSALAQYHQSMVSKEKKEIGEELARLQEALRLMQQAVSYFTNAGIPHAFKAEAAIIQKAHDSAKKDNDFIYHERIPDFKTLAVLEKAVLAKPLPVNTPYFSRFKDLFEQLVPVAVHSACAMYEARRNEIVNMETARLKEHTQLMNGLLASLNLPAALEDAENAETLPESIREKSSRVKSGGGAQALATLQAELPNLFARNKEILDETTRLLTEEKTSDDQLRSQFKEKWTRMASEKLTEPLWQELGKYRQILDTAGNADGIVRQKFDNARHGIELLSKPEPELKATIPGCAEGAKASSTAVNELKQQMTEVETIRQARDKLEKELKDRSFDMTSTFLCALGETGGIPNEQQLSTDKLNEIFAPIRTEISASLQQQEQLMQKVQAANQRFNQEKAGGGKGAEREQMLKQLASAHDAFMELRGNLQEGTKFYNDLTPLVVRLQQKVSDFCFARKTEKEDLMRDLQQTIVNQPPLQSVANSPTTASAPPPRPPPPVVGGGATGDYGPNNPFGPPQTQPMYTMTPAAAPQGYYQQPPTTAGAPPQQAPYQPQQQQAPYQPPQQQGSYQPQQQPQAPPPGSMPYPMAQPYPMAYGTYPGATPHYAPYPGAGGQPPQMPPGAYSPYAPPPPGYPYPPQQQWRQ